MKILIPLFIFFVTGNSTSAQTIISGKISDSYGKPVSLANVYLKQTYEGTVSNEEGSFSFVTSAKGIGVLIISATGMKVFEKEITLKNDSLAIIAVLQEQVALLGDFVVTAGSFEASDKKRGVQLRSLDIVTTAGSGGDIYGALQTLPGVAPGNSESGLLVRGGAAHESKTIIDGMMVTNPFFGDVPDIPARARFSAFGFSGMVFSAGGYSAEYGQALSSVLLLNSNNNFEENSNSLSITAASAAFSATKIFKGKRALYADANMSNLHTLFRLVPQNREWQTPPKGVGTTIAYVADNDSGTHFRIQAKYQHNNLALYLPDTDNSTTKTLFSNQTVNQTIYTVYTKPLRNGWKLFSGLSFQYDNQQKMLNTTALPQRELFMQLRSAINKRINRFIQFKTGIEWQRHFFRTTFNQWQHQFDNVYVGGFAEADSRLSGRFMMKTGIRLENSLLNKNSRLSPRLVMVYKTGQKSQLSAAYGHFYQHPSNQLFAQNNHLRFEKAVHYLVNYQYMNSQYTLRLEAFYKKYTDLTTFSGFNNRLQDISNNGKGYAKGVDVFLRDNKSGIKNLDYWISYSYIQSERIFQNLRFMATPSFAPAHTLNLVTKYELDRIRSRISLTYTYSSAKYFYNPVSFERFSTDNFQNVSFSCSHITSVFKMFTVLYLSVANLFNISNIINYRFSDDGVHVQKVVPSAFRSFFIGTTMRF